MVSFELSVLRPEEEKEKIWSGKKEELRCRHDLSLTFSLSLCFLLMREEVYILRFAVATNFVAHSSKTVTCQSRHAEPDSF